MRLRVNAPPPGLPPQLNGRSKGANLVVGLISMSKKLPISAPQPPLQSPFSTLSNAGLPEGLADSTSATAKTRFRVVLRRERVQRGGKTVIVVSQLPTHLSVSEIVELARGVRRNLACGGAVRGREIEIQGDQAQRVRRYFEACGYEVVGP
jgi:translation initiation factor 1